jgi:SM-20-related protein
MILSREGDNNSLFEAIAKNILSKGYSIHKNALPVELLTKLCGHLHKLPSYKFKNAGVGREINHTVNKTVRTDEVFWIDGENKAEQAWLCWAESLQNYLNRRLFLGLLSFESHFAHYSQGDFYKKHTDSFKGKANRVLSIVVYLNNGWFAKDGGEFIIYTGKSKMNAIKMLPELGSIAVFLSEEFPHEVLPANRDRFSIAGWFRIRNSTT